MRAWQRLLPICILLVLAAALLAGSLLRLQPAVVVPVGAALIALLGWAAVQEARPGPGKSREEEPAGGSFQSLVMGTPAPVSVLDLSGRIVATNQAFQEVVDLTADDLNGRDAAAFSPAEDADIRRRLLGELAAEKRDRYVVTTTILRRDGRAVPVRVTGFRAGKSIVEVLTDLSEQAEAKSALDSSQLLQKAQQAAIHVLADAESLDTAITRLLEALGENGSWDAGAFWNFDRPINVLRCTHLWRRPGIQVPEFIAATMELALPSGSGLPGHVWHTGEPAWLDEVDGEKTGLRALKAAKEGLQSAFAFPIVFEGEVHGVIELLSTQPLRSDAALPSIRTIGVLLGRFVERDRADETLRASEEQYRTITEISHDAVITIDEESRMLLVNQATERIFGYTRDELLGQPLTMLMPENMRALHGTGLERYRDTGRRRVRWDAMEVPGLHKSGREISLEIALAEFTQRGKRTFTGYVRDITERKQEESALVYQGQHDALTHLPNRTLLVDRVQQVILVGARHNTPVGLILMDLDRFKEVNDTFGHHSGDLLLQQVASRLVTTIRESDTVARLGGDEFAVLLPSSDEDGAVLAARRIVDVMGKPFTLEGRELDVGVSIGIGLYPEHGSDAAMLMRRADVAMYAAKRSGRDFTVYSPERDENSSGRLLLTGELRQAIESGQLLLMYQPKVNLEDGTTHNVEALVRWNHPDRGLSPPDQFIPLAEETGLVKPLTVWVLNEALRQHCAWRDAGFDIHIAVNFSARTLHDPDLLHTVTGLLQQWNVDPSRLAVEITESAIMLDPDRAMKTLTDLHDAGVWTSIDDFGTGYSSLGYLRKLPVDEIKIDKSFVIDMAGNRDDASIVQSVVQLGHNLGLQVVAEGVENRRTLDMLRGMSCNLAQGSFLSTPLVASELTEWLKGPKQRLSVVS
jgi:diguanylate cyclase (GGDEF)-like protein/PAS domain S-box-containing protein